MCRRFPQLSCGLCSRTGHEARSSTLCTNKTQYFSTCSLLRHTTCTIFHEKGVLTALAARPTGPDTEPVLTCTSRVLKKKKEKQTRYDNDDDEQLVVLYNTNLLFITTVVVAVSLFLGSFLSSSLTAQHHHHQRILTIVHLSSSLCLGSFLFVNHNTISVSSPSIVCLRLFASVLSRSSLTRLPPSPYPHHQTSTTKRPLADIFVSCTIKTKVFCVGVKPVTRAEALADRSMVSALPLTAP